MFTEALRRRSSARALILLALGLAVSPLSPRPVQAQAKPAAVDPAARSAFDAGAEAYDHGRFGDALREFERAYQISPHPKLLFNIGRAADGDGQSERAITAYNAYLRAFPNADNREFVESRIAKLQAAAPPSAPVVAPVAAPPAVSLAPADVAAAQLAAESAQPSAPSAPADGDARPYWKRGWFWGAVGVVVAGVITAAVVVAVKNGGDDHGGHVRGPQPSLHVQTLVER